MKYITNKLKNSKKDKFRDRNPDIIIKLSKDKDNSERNKREAIHIQGSRS